MWSKSKRDRILRRAALVERYVRRLRRQVKEHTPKRELPSRIKVRPAPPAPMHARDPDPADAA